MAKGKPGQPTKFTPDRVAVIIEELKKHNYASTACDKAGVSETTFYNWLNKAEGYLTKLITGDSIGDEGERYIEFFDSIKRTRAESESGLLGLIADAGSKPTLIEKRTIEHTLKDGSNKTETIERWKPPDWTANAWILERTRWEKYGQHSSLDIQQAGVIFIERLQRARTARVVDGEFREIEDIAKEPTVIEEPGPALIPAPAASHKATEPLKTAPQRRPIFELIAKTRESRQLATSQIGICQKLADQAQPVGGEVIEEAADERSAAQKSEGGES
jgi:hypothetical protein